MREIDTIVNQLEKNIVEETYSPLETDKIEILY